MLQHFFITHAHPHTPSHLYMAHPHTEDEDNLVPMDISCLPCPTPSPDRTPEPERSVVSMGRVWPSHEQLSANIFLPYF